MEKEVYSRGYTLFSLCGLNCGLCPMHHIRESSHCPGCGGEGAQKCSIVKCSRQHGGIEYCYQCAEYPCKKLAGTEEFDSFITYRNRLKDLDKAKRIGIDAYRSELNQKVEILRNVLKCYNDGRRKTFFCLAINLFELQDVKQAVQKIKGEMKQGNTVAENSMIAVRVFQAIANERGISLRLNRKK